MVLSRNKAVTVTPGSTYVLSTPTLAIRSDGAHGVAVTIPRHALVRVVEIENPMVRVRWEEKTVLLFAVDLAKRGVQVRSAR
jgi:hypothetical protein